MQLSSVPPTKRIPIIAIDGPTASGKGTVAQLVARALDFHYLDSGALYRIVGLASKIREIPFENTQALSKMVQQLSIRFESGKIYLDNEDVSEAIRSEEMGQRASRSGAIGSVRTALYDLQRSFLEAPGLVADGRDMATVIFPEADVKVYLTANPQIRAERRYKQLIAKGISANIEVLLQDLIERDVRDTQRLDAPLIQAKGAYLLDTSYKGVDQAVQEVLDWYYQLK